MNTQSDIMKEYLSCITNHLNAIREDQTEPIKKVAKVLADHIAKDKLVYIYGPGGHSNLGAMEIFFRAGGLMHISAILDEGTLLSNGALRSMQIERTPGYGKIVIDDNGIGKGDLLIIVNAYGINTACIDAALEAKRLGATTIAVTSVEHAKSTPKDHVARHPSKQNLFEVCDYYIDCKVRSGDAVCDISGIPQKMGAMSTFANAYVLNTLMMYTAAYLGEKGIEVPIWRSGNCPGGDEWNNKFTAKFKGKVRWL